MSAVRRPNTTPSPSSPAPGSAEPRSPEPQVRPGAVYPLRAMGQDEMFSGAFSVIRRNRRAVLGLPLLAGVLNFATAILLMLLFPSQQFMRMLLDPAAFDDPEMAWAVMGDGAMWLVLMLTGFIGNLVLALSVGLLAIPALRAAYGLPTTLGQTIRLRAGTLGWLALHCVVLGLLLAVAGVIVLVLSALLIGVTFFIAAVVVLPGLFLLLCWVSAAFMFGPMVIVVERRNAFSALARSFSLNRGLWWRHIGAVALVYLIGTIALLIASLPAGIVAGFGTELGWQAPQGQESWISILLLAVGNLYDAVLAALMVALAGTVIAVMYLNARFRQEALDAVLLDAAADVDDPATLIPGSPEHLGAHFSAAGSGRPE
ncbi:hypothetical protein [Garicola koreensis]|uniref:Putative membrane protein YhdT n=1 Tax=Garicola koreensis TaxID=1262554 RepID=A0A7W5XL57_9MICC|nr:hypothetical protein [Garicola koreensis]MBB3667730.1 putative membrane protein YhdT [Garicola koreensis]